MRITKRVRLFIRDYWDEFPVVWSLARTRDCERSGGHRFGEPKREAIGVMRTCSRCGCGESVERTAGTGSSVPTVTVYANNTTMTGQPS